MRTAEVDALILQLAGTQHGIVARWQLLPAGVSATLLDQRLARRRLERVARGVYHVPGSDGPRRSVITAVFACGAYAVASHHTAGELQSVLTQRPERAVVSTWRGHPSRRPDVVLHRVQLPADERCICDGVPVTSPARTLLDVASTLSSRGLEQAVARAFRVGIVTSDELLALVARYPRRPGSPQLRAILAADEAPALTRSEAEERFLALVRVGALPHPRVNARVRGFEVDFFWPASAVVVEIDGHAYHSARDAQQRDRRRDSSLGAAGIRVLRFTWDDLTTRAEATLVKVAMAVGRGRGAC